MYCGNTLVSHQNNSLLIIKGHMFRCKLCAAIRSNCTLRSSLPLSHDSVTGSSPHPKKNSCSPFKIHFKIIIPPSISRCSTWSLIFPFSHKPPIYSTFLLPHCGIYSVCLVLLHSIALIISG